MSFHFQASPATIVAARPSPQSQGTEPDSLLERSTRRRSFARSVHWSTERPPVMEYDSTNAAQQQPAQLQGTERSAESETFQTGSGMEQATRRVRFASNVSFSNETRQQEVEAQNRPTLLFGPPVFSFGNAGNGAPQQQPEARNNGSPFALGRAPQRRQRIRLVLSRNHNPPFVFGNAGNSAEQQVGTRRDNDRVVQQHPGVFAFGNERNVVEQQQGQQASQQAAEDWSVENSMQLAERERTRAHNLWRASRQADGRSAENRLQLAERERTRAHNLWRELVEQRVAQRQSPQPPRVRVRARIHSDEEDEQGRVQQGETARSSRQESPEEASRRIRETARASTASSGDITLRRLQQHTESLRREIEESRRLEEEYGERLAAQRSAISAVSRTTATTENMAEMIAARRAAISALTDNAGTTTTSHSMQVGCPSQEEVSHDRPSSEGAPACVICQENVPICIALPCLHMSYCVECARSLCLHNETGLPKLKGRVTCAKCRQPVNAVSRVFVET